MKKKSILVLLIIMCIGVFTPFLVNAKECNQESIKLKSIKLKEKSEYTEELTEATIDNNKINLDLKMYNVGDYIVYTLKVKNESDENYYFDENLLNIKSNYFDYSLSYKDNSNKIEANTEKTVYLKVKYNKEVENDKFFSGKYVNKNNVLLDISTKNPILTNPLTKNNKLLLSLILLVIGFSIIYLNKNGKLKLNIFIIFLLSVFIPIESYALCEVKLDINSNITVGKVKPNPCTYDGELVQGAEYVNGQYIYRYMQEGISNDWQNIGNDGWGVILTDKESTDDVSTKLCTSINDKSIVSMSYMFSGSKTNKIDLESFDTSNVKNMTGMFAGQSKIKKLDLSQFDTSKVEYFNIMFASTILTDLNLNYWDLSSADGDRYPFTGMFGNVLSLKNLYTKNWKLPKKTGNILGCSNSALCSTDIDYLDVSGWNLSESEDISELFRNLLVPKIIGLDTWDTSNVKKMNNMFDYSNIKELNLSRFNMKNIESVNSLLYGARYLEKVKLDDWDLSNIKSDSIYIFGNNPTLKEISAKNWKINFNPQNILSDKPSLEKVDVTGWDTSNVTSLRLLFSGDNNLKNIIGLDTWDVSKVKNMTYMFNFCKELKSIDLSSWNTKSLTDFSAMFNHCDSMEFINLDNWNLKNLSENAGYPWYSEVPAKKVSLRNWKLGPNMYSYLFDYNYIKVEELDLTGWDLSEVRNLNLLFGYAKTLKKVKGLETWDTSNIENMSSMFTSVDNLEELDLSSWDTSKVTNMNSMFDNSNNLKTIYVGDKFNTNSVTDSGGMFSNTPLLVGGNGTTYDSNHVDKEYARIDEPGKPGYFTRK